MRKTRIGKEESNMREREGGVAAPPPGAGGGREEYEGVKEDKYERRNHRKGKVYPDLGYIVAS